MQLNTISVNVTQFIIEFQFQVPKYKSAMPVAGLNSQPNAVSSIHPSNTA